MKQRSNLILGHEILNDVIRKCLKHYDSYRGSNIAIIRATNCYHINASHLMATKISTKNKIEALNKIRFNSIIHEIPCGISLLEIEELFCNLNSNSSIKAILVQVPLPKYLYKTASLISPGKDIDGITGRGHFKSSATAESAFRVIQYYLKKLENNGSVALVGGKGYVGNGIAHLLKANDIAFFVIEKEDSLDLIKQAAIVVSATGIPNLIQPNHLRKGQMVVDIGFSVDVNTPGKFSGDIDRNAYPFLQYVTPVPHGIGPLNIAVLLERVLLHTAKIELEKWTIDM